MMIIPSPAFFVFTILVASASIFVPLAMILVVLWQAPRRRENRLMALFLISIMLGGLEGFLRQFTTNEYITADLLTALVLTAFLLSSSALLGFISVSVMPERRWVYWWAQVSIGLALASLLFSSLGWLYTNAELWGTNLITFEGTILLGLLTLNAFLQLIYVVGMTFVAHKRLPSKISWAVYTFVVVYVVALVYPPFVETSLSLLCGLVYSFLFSYAIFAENYLNPLIRLNQQLQESEARYRAIVDMVFDLDYVIEHAENGGYLFNWTKSNRFEFSRFPTKTDWQLDELRQHIAPAHHHDLQAFLDNTLRGQPSKVEFEIESISGGENIWIKNYIYPVWDSEKQMPERAYGVARDITVEKHAQQALEASESRFRAMFSQTLHMIILFDGTGHFIESNEMFRQFIGMDDAHFAGQHVLTMFESFGEPSEMVRAKQLFDSIFDGHFSRGEWLARNREDEWRTLDVSFHSIEEIDGKPSLLLWEARDITERKQAIAAMIQAQKVESLGVLAGGVAHDFNNLLTGILAQSSLALHKLGDVSSASKNIRKAILAAEQAATLARQMLAYAGQGEFVVESFCLNDVVHSNVDLFKASTGAHVSLELELGADIPLIYADRGQTQQIVMNLMINAAEAIGDGQGEVVIRTAVRELSEPELRRFASKSALPAGQYVILDVEDNGCGLSSEVKARIFDPFFSTKADGRGLGLAALLGAVYAQSGGVTVESTEQVGTQFQVLFPAAPSGQTDLTHSIDMEGSVWETDERFSVLVADDESAIRDVIREGCERLGWTVYAAHNGLDALAKYKEHQADIDLVILDMQMPIMAGAKTYWALKEIRSDLPVIISSGYNSSDSAQYIRTHERVSFLQKPYQIESLINKILELMAKSEANH